MFHPALIVLLPLWLGSVQGVQEETIELYPGEIRGTTMTTRNGRNISAFLGIPYAKPPVGPLRFKSPQIRHIDEKKVTVADKEGNQCPQLNEHGEVVGDEDCLYLNVYTPDTFPDEPLPTMVYFHGGGFVEGSGTSKDAGPDYLLDRNVVLVTVNYRLGVLGFLSTGDAEAPGNFGHKDQVAALKWVQYNIIIFAGDPNSVTIFGQGAGGASTSLLAVSDSSKGLFHRYISQSGNCVSFWVTERLEDYTKLAWKLGNYLNCSTSSSKVLVDCLREVDTRSLVDSNDIFKDQLWVFKTWGPTMEDPNMPDAFLTFNPVPKMINREGANVRDVPAMLGNVVDEGLILTAHFQTNSTIYDTISSDVYGFFVYVMMLFMDPIVPDVTDKMVQSFYLNGTKLSDKEALTQKITSFITDLGFAVPLNYQIQAMKKAKKKSPIYYYSFAYRDTHSKTYLTTGSNEDIGVTHGDDNIYLFPTKKLDDGSSDLQFSDSDEKMIDIMVDLWTSFAATGTPIANSTSDPNIWQAYDSNMENNLQIGNNSDPVLSTQFQLHNYSVSFWDFVLLNDYYLGTTEMNV